MENLTNEDAFEAEVTGPEGLRLAYFTAEWCGPCRMLKPLLEQLEEENDGLTVTRIDVDTYPGLAREFQVMSIPTLIGFVSGEQLFTQIGVATKKALLDKFSPHL